MTEDQGQASVARAQDEQQRWLRDLQYEVWQGRLEFYGELIDKLANERYPSPQMLDVAERGLPPELYPDYIEMLTEKVLDSNYPSPMLLARLDRITNVPRPPDMPNQR